MSMQNFQTFMAKLSEDSALRDELRNAAPEGMSPEQLAQAAVARGFAFEAKDVTGSLEDADLDAVAGGHEGIKFTRGIEQVSETDVKGRVMPGLVGLNKGWKFSNNIFKF